VDSLTRSAERPAEVQTPEAPQLTLAIQQDVFGGQERGPSCGRHAGDRFELHPVPAIGRGGELPVDEIASRSSGIAGSGGGGD
jgi:hypothetical protein